MRARLLAGLPIVFPSNECAALSVGPSRRVTASTSAVVSKGAEPASYAHSPQTRAINGLDVYSFGTVVLASTRGIHNEVATYVGSYDGLDHWESK